LTQGLFCKRQEAEGNFFFLRAPFKHLQCNFFLFSEAIAHARRVSLRDWRREVCLRRREEEAKARAKPRGRRVFARYSREEEEAVNKERDSAFLRALFVASLEGSVTAK
jgi:hypothetical protein